MGGERGDKVKNEEQMLTASECILKYGLDWKVESKPVSVDGKQVEGYQAIQRADNGQVFQVARGRYEPVQNVEAFKFFDEIVQTGQAKYHSAGSYKGGAVVWIRAKLPYNFEVLPGDEVATYLRLLTSHDGSTPLEIAPEVVRLVCTNGMQALVVDATKRIASRHTENVRGRFLAGASEILKVEIDYFKRFAEHCKAMAKQEMTGLEIDSFLHKLFNLSEKDDDNSTRVKNQVEEINRLHVNGTGSDIVGVRNTKWGVYNAVTEYIDRYRSTKGDAVNREHSSFMGSGSQLREKAFALLTR